MQTKKWMTLAAVMVAFLLIGNDAMAQQAADNSKGLIGIGTGVGPGSGCNRDSRP